ncbi:hypothetical protein E4U53_005697 [Claviceps sorghi]|nr:hypothetical protein E4U53_005697 [Claviceps sorghi]
MFFTDLPKKFLMFLVASYGVTNFILFIMSLVTYHKTRQIVSTMDCTLKHCYVNMATWAVYPFIAVAAAICFLTASIMFFNMVVRARNTAADPLYVFRGIIITLLVLTPIVAMGWVRPSVGIVMEKQIGEDSPGSHLPVTDKPTLWPGNTTGFIGIFAAMGSSEAMAGEAISYVGLTGAFLLRLARALPGAGTVALSHFNVLFGATIATMSAAMASPVGAVSEK